MKYFQKIIILTLILTIILAVYTSAATTEQKTIGEENAPVEIILFTDLQGPFDARWHTQTLPQIDQEYIQSGKVKVSVKYFPLAFHTEAFQASLAAECAAEQNRFFDYTDILYNNQDQLSEQELMDYANNLGIDTDKFSTCYSKDKTRLIVNGDLNEANKLKLSGAPSFFINGKLIVGAQPYEAFKTVIDDALGNNTLPPPPEPSTPEPENMQKEPKKGSSDAKVKIISYMGYNEPFSHRSWNTINTLFNEFGEKNIQLEFRNFPLIFQDPTYITAQAGECVYSLSNDETFFAYSNLLMKRENNDYNSLLADAESLGIGSYKMKTCLDQETFLPEVLDDLEEGNDDEITGTPTFFINDQKIVGAQPYQIFEELIKKILGENTIPGEITKEDLEKIPKYDKEDTPISSTNSNDQEIEALQKRIDDLEKKLDENNKKLEENNSLLEKILSYFGKFFGK